MRYCRTLVICLILLCPFSALALVNINTASLSELDTLPGVGPSTAQKIIDARPFSAAGDIQNVQGIGGPGTKTYDDIISLITVSGETTVIVDEEDEEDEEEKENEDKEEDEDDESSNNDEEPHEPVSGLLVKTPSVAYVGQMIQFDVNPVDGTNDRLVRYLWNFGDGSASSEKSPRHQYTHPGTYVIIVESYFQKEAKVARREISVLPLALDIKPVMGGISISNIGEHEVDLSGLTLSGLGEFIFPKHTILLAGKSMVIDDVTGSSVSVKDMVGKTLAYSNVAADTGAKPKSTPLISTRAKTPLSTATTSIEAPKLGPEARDIGIENIAAAGAAPIPDNAWPYLGLMAVMSFGFIALFGIGKT